MKNNIKLLQILNATGIIGVLIVNFLANSLPINGMTTGEVSNQYSTLFTPAGYTFAIWSVIFLGLLLFGIYQLSSWINAKNEESKAITSAMGYAVFLNSIANMGWIIAWHHQQFLVTIGFMLIILSTLLYINRTIYLFDDMHDSSKWFRRFVEIPFGLYLGWICVATIANVAVYLQSINAITDPYNERILSIIMIIISGLVATVLVYKWRNIPSAIAIVWGLLGIYFKRFDYVKFNPIMSTTLIMTLVILVVSVIVVRPRKVKV